MGDVYFIAPPHTTGIQIAGFHTKRIDPATRIVAVPEALAPHVDLLGWERTNEGASVNISTKTKASLLAPLTVPTKEQWLEAGYRPEVWDATFGPNAVKPQPPAPVAAVVAPTGAAGHEKDSEDKVKSFFENLGRTVHAEMEKVKATTQGANDGKVIVEQDATAKATEKPTTDIDPRVTATADATKGRARVAPVKAPTQGDTTPQNTIDDAHFNAGKAL